MKQAQESKSKSEELGYSILPRDIVTELDQGGKDTSFSVSIISVILIDVAKFS